MVKIVILAALVAALIAAVTAARELEVEWSGWKEDHGRYYGSTAEENHRYGVWKRNTDMISSHNKMADGGEYGYWLGMNHLGDMTREEIASSLNGYAMQTRNSTNVFKPSLDFIPEDSVDWRSKGAVTPVRDQGQCGSCWAFSATGAMEGQHFLKEGKLVPLSEQNLLDCSKPEGNLGCEGGEVDYAFVYIIKNHGIDTESSYPYQGQEEKCRFNASNVGATAKSKTDILSGSTQGLLEACSRVGPISVGMDSSLPTFHFYKKGIFSEDDCSSTKLDHGVLVVGYGTEGGVDYFLVKNSWGTGWGMDGYFMISRKDNMCGLATNACFPII